MNADASPLPISAVIITRDAAPTLRATLESLAGFDEVVVYDNGSQDDTCAIAREFANVVLHEGDFFGFGPTKNHAAGLARNDWVLSIDADERVGSELWAGIAAADQADPAVAYSVHRANFLMGREVRHAGWGYDWLVRLYHRKATRLTEVMVHEIVLPPAGGRVVRLHGDLLHDAVRDLGSFLVKIDRYSELRREDPPSASMLPLIVARSTWSFIRSYFIRLGILDGWRGLVIAISDANGTFFKYMKPYADRAVERERSSAGDQPQ